MVSSSRYRGWSSVRAQHHRLVHQADQGRHDVIAAQGAARADLLGGRDAERAGEDRQPGPQQPLGGRAQVVAPLGRRAEGLLVRQGDPAPAGEHQEAVLKPAGQGPQRGGPQLNGGQLDRQRDAVKPPAQPGDLVAVRVGDGEAGYRRRGALREQLDRVPAARAPPARERAAAAAGRRARRARRAAACCRPAPSPPARRAAARRRAARTPRRRARTCRGRAAGCGSLR